MVSLSPETWLSPSTWLRFSHISNFGFLLSQFLLILIPTNRDPVTDFVSEYVFSSIAWVFFVGLLFQLMTALFQAHVLFYFVDRVHGIIMAVWAVSIIGIAIFPTDPGGIPETVTGYLHMIFVFVGLIAFVVICFRLAQLSNDEFLKRLVLMLVVSFFFFLASVPFGLVGVTERLLLFLVFVIHYILVSIIEKQISST